jgi:predicted RNase H-like HicB family nuclease
VIPAETLQALIDEMRRDAAGASADGWPFNNPAILLNRYADRLAALQGEPSTPQLQWSGPDEDGDYLVTVTGCDGLLAHGETRRSALRCLAEALASWLDAVGEPSTPAGQESTMPRDVLAALAGDDPDKRELLAAWDRENELRHRAEDELASLKASPSVPGGAALLNDEELGWAMRHVRKLLEREHRYGVDIATCAAPSCAKYRDIEAKLATERRSTDGR